MAEYKGVKGITIQNLSADPPAPILGQVWYNTTSTTMKCFKGSAGAWATGTATTVARAYPASAGTSTACIAFGNDGGGSKTNVESWNGSSWTEVADISARTSPGGSGTSTAAICIGGHDFVALTEVWNGSTWTEVADLTTGRGRACAPGNGTTTATTFAGGQVYPTIYALTETWNGTSWTEVADLNQGRNFLSGLGTSTAMLAIGGFTGTSEPTTLTDLTESWNGTSWTELGDLSTPRAKSGQSSGTSTAAMIFGGQVTGTALTETWNGSSWTEVADLATARYGVGGAGSSTSSLAIDGKNPSGTNVTTVEEWADPVLSTKTFTAS